MVFYTRTKNRRRRNFETVQMARLHQRLIDEEDEEQLIFLFRETKRLKEVCAPSRLVYLNFTCVCGRNGWPS